MWIYTYKPLLDADRHIKIWQNQPNARIHTHRSMSTHERIACAMRKPDLLVIVRSFPGICAAITSIGGRFFFFFRLCLVRENRLALPATYSKHRFLNHVRAFCPLHPSSPTLPFLCLYRIINFLFIFLRSIQIRLFIYLAIASVPLSFNFIHFVSPYLSLFFVFFWHSLMFSLHPCCRFKFRFHK